MNYCFYKLVLLFQMSVFIKSFSRKVTNKFSRYSSQSSLRTIAYDDHQEYEKELINRKVFCNVELNGESIEAVGFDMDFTLAQYKQAFDLLAFEGAKEKLITKLGYPSVIALFQYNPDLFRRGLIIDKAEGNVLKIDRHKYHRKVCDVLCDILIKCCLVDTHILYLSRPHAHFQYRCIMA